MRQWHHFRAWIGGYFWAPCPLCGYYYGGHEWKDYDGKPSQILVSQNVGHSICPRCTKAGKGQEFPIPKLEVEEVENPDTWGPAEHIVNSVLVNHREASRERPIATQLVGFSLAKQITTALSKAGLLKEEAK